MLISIGLYMCAPLDWQYTELPSSASDAVLCTVRVSNKKKLKKKRSDEMIHQYYILLKESVIFTT